MTLSGPILVVGTGLLGTSVGLACRRAGITVYLDDVHAAHRRTAASLGAGVPWHGEPVELVVVAVPPDHVAAVIADALERTDAFVTDVGSVKGQPLHEIGARRDAVRYVGGHPMAGSERSGPLAASSALFDGRPWAVAPHAGSLPEAVAAVEALVAACGAVPHRLDPDDHDLAVARTSHLPQLLSVLMAAQLADAPEEHLALSGQGVRDVTRIAASDPELWVQIVDGNAEALGALLHAVREDLDRLIAAVTAGEREALEGLFARGVAGTVAIPGKHGGPAVPTATVFVSIPDHPGELARLFADAGAAGVNIEDVRIDHDPGREMGLVEVVVAEDRAEALHDALESRGWVTHR